MFSKASVVKKYHKAIEEFFAISITIFATIYLIFFNDVFGFLPSNNAPSGISLFYFLLDIGCFVVYTLVNNKGWKRAKKLKKFKE